MLEIKMLIYSSSFRVISRIAQGNGNSSYENDLRILLRSVRCVTTIRDYR